jgi:hypothetical protein
MIPLLREASSGGLVAPVETFVLPDEKPSKAFANRIAQCRVGDRGGQDVDALGVFAAREVHRLVDPRVKCGQARRHGEHLVSECRQVRSTKCPTLYLK